jgi:hypothetical protein
VTECKANVDSNQCIMRFPEVYSGETMCINSTASAKDLELVMECTTNGCSKQCMMRFPEVSSGDMLRIKSIGLAKDLELIKECIKRVTLTNA